VTARFAADVDYAGLCYAIAVLIPAGVALWQASHSHRRSSRLGLRLAGLALLVYGLATGLLVTRGAGLAALTLPVQVLRGLGVLGVMAGGWLCGKDRGLRGPRSLLIRRGLLCAGFGLLLGSGWILVDGRARAADAATGRCVVEVARGVQAESEVGAGAVDLPEADSPAKVHGKPGTWEQYSSQRLWTGLPVLLGIFLLIAATVAVSAIRS
jgi:hypothetical protein